MLIGDQVVLRSFELTDTQQILKHYNDLEVRRFLDNPEPISKEECNDWIRKTWENRQKGSAYFFAIDLKKTKELIGVCALFAISPINHSAEIYIVIYNKAFWNKHLGTEALQLLLGYGFNYLNLHRIFLYTHDINTRAQRVYEKLGFKKTGKRREGSFFEGEFHDLLLYDLLVEEFGQ
jgi:RimJ/RimL family protein N-acetyltransferase